MGPTEPVRSASHAVLRQFRDAAERAMALNPRNSHPRAYLGLLIAFSGEWDRGLALVQRAMALNPHLPDWVYLPYF